MSRQTPTERRARFPGALLTAGVALLATLCVYNRGINLLDEGFLASAGERVADGQLPYRDFFSLVTPGSFCLHAGMFALFGRHLEALRWLVLMLGTVIPVLVYLIARRLVEPLFAFAAALLSVAWGVGLGYYPLYSNYSWYACMFSLAGCWQATRFAAARDRPAAPPPGGTSAPGPTPRGALALAGVFFGLSFLFKQNTGLLGLCGAVAYLLLTGLRRPRALVADLAALGGAAAAVNLPALLWIALGGGLPAMIRDLVVFPRTFGSHAATPFPPAWPELPATGRLGPVAALILLQSLGYALAAWIPLLYPAAGVVLIARALRRRSSFRHAQALVLLHACFAFLIIVPRPDVVHVATALHAGFPLVALALAWSWAKRSTPLGRTSGWLARGAGLAAMLVLLGGPALSSFFHYLPMRRALETPRAHVRVTPEAAAQIEGVLGEIDRRTRPGEAILVVPWAAMYYFLSGRRNPTHYDLLVVGNIDPAGEQEMIRDLERDPPRLVVRGRLGDVDRKPLEECAPRVARYLAAHYRTVATHDGYEFQEPSRGVESDAGFSHAPATLLTPVSPQD